MHIPDGILDPLTLGVTATLGIGGVVIAAKGQAGDLSEERAPFVGVLGAFVFAAQMIKFPIFASVTTHLVGTALLVRVLGVRTSIVTMAAVLLVQALLFQDGGLIALGANVFNMAIVGSLAAGTILRVLPRRTGTAAFVSMVTAGSMVALELMIAGYDPGIVLGMLPLCATAGLAEAIITVLCLTGIRSIAPDLLDAPTARTLTDPPDDGAPPESATEEESRS